MLVLSRKLNESIMIGDDIELLITELKKDKVKIGITAPREVSVHRKEIWTKIQKEKGEKHGSL